MQCALRFSFKASNNEVEYEALIIGLKLARKMKVESLEIYNNSQLIVFQVIDKYQARGEKMVAYLQKAKDLLSAFSSVKIQQVPRELSTQVDALARLASTKDTKLLVVILVEFLNEPSMQSMDLRLTIDYVTTTDTWMTPIVQYLKDGQLLKDKRKARLLRLKATRYILYDGHLYRRGFSTPLLKCVDLAEGNYVL